ncbi:MAG: HAMP domain-containing protein [Methylococcus sp.]|nr:MAG: HAMP domain-containing protein [Methylococcus sp.]
MARRTLRPPLTLSIIALFLAILVSLHLMSTATQDASELGEMYSSLVLTNGLASLILLGLVGANIYWLSRQLKKKAAGSNLTSRMIFLFSLLSLAPASIVFYYSVQFLDRSVDSWFDVNVDQAMDDALELGQTALDERMRNLLKETEQIAQQLSTSPISLLGVRLGELNENEDADLTLFSRQGQIIGFNGSNTETMTPNLPEIGIMVQVRQGKPYIGLETIGHDGLQIRAVVSLIGEDAIFLQAIYRIPRQLAQLTDSVQAAYQHYKELTFLRRSLKFTFTLTLSLILLLSLLAAVWAAFLSIRRIVEPVRLLAIGTRAIAEGDYEKRLPVKDRGELGFLVESFNTMTNKIAQARDEAQQSKWVVERQRAYLETVLASLSSAVLSLDAELRVLTANQSANHILHADFEQYIGWPLAVLCGAYPHIAELMSQLELSIKSEVPSWKMELTLNSPAGRQELFCRGSSLYGNDDHYEGLVLIIDDVTALIQAQRSTAWSEVARRLAHEIKNPLTPIQLSAERLRHKLAKTLEGPDLEVLEKSTRTIVQQVEAMKTMVNAFGEYAKPSIIQLRPLGINPLLEEVVALYPPNAGLHFTLQLDPHLPDVLGDPVKLRQVIHNLIKNAAEAMPQGQSGKMTIKTAFGVSFGTGNIELRLSDDGPGIAPDQAERIFEPYVTSKTKGTGLGLAIVRRIIEELGGQIKLDTAYRHGASFIITLPLAQPPTHMNDEQR